MLKFAALALALAAPIAIATPAHAADVKTLSCVEKNLDKAGRAALNRDLAKNLQNAGGGQTYGEDTVAALRGAAQTCKAKHGWSEAATQAAILYTVPKVGWPLAVQIGRANGLKPNALLKRVNALTPEEKAEGTSERVISKLATASAEAGEINADNAAVAGALYGLLTLKEKAYIDFQKS